MSASGLRRGEGTIDPRERADGSTVWQARWSEQDRRGRRVWRARTFPSEDAARAHLIDVAREKATGSGPRGPVTVADAIRDYQRRGARRWSGATVASYDQRARRHVLPHLGNVPLDRLTTLRVQRWVDTLDADGLAPSTVQTAHSCLSGALKEAVRLGLLSRNPATGVRLPKRERSPGRAWTADEARAVLAASADHPRWHALYQLVLTTGLRPGEARALRWEDVDFDQARLRVRRTVAHLAGGGYGVRESTKTGTERTVPLTLPALRALTVWRQQNDGPWVFATGAKPLLNQAWVACQRRLCAAAGVPVIRLHDIRHSAISLLLERGVPVRTVSDIAGHLDIKTTLGVYAHASDQSLRAAAEGLATALNGADVHKDVREPRPLTKESAS